MAVALDREAILANVGGDFYGDYGDGFDQAEHRRGLRRRPASGPTSSVQPVPNAGDPALAKKLITDSGEAAPALTFDFPDTPDQPEDGRDRHRLARQGWHHCHAGPDCAARTTRPSSTRNGHNFGTAGWGADWPNASTVIPPLFTEAGGWDLSQVDDAAFEAKIRGIALTTLIAPSRPTFGRPSTRTPPRTSWTIPTFFGKQPDHSAGDEGRALPYRWAAYGSWPYGVMARQ